MHSAFPTPPPDADVAAAKAALRPRAAAARRQAAAEGGAAAAAGLAGQAGALRRLVPEGAAVAGYFPMGDEIDPLPLLADLRQRGCPLALPVVSAREQPLLFRGWNPGETLEAGPHGTRQPAALAPAVVPALVLVPLLAFDGRGFRLGYGGGYYDRTLERLRCAGTVVAVGLAFADQRVAAVPHAPHDQPLDLILTEAGPLMPERA